MRKTYFIIFISWILLVVATPPLPAETLQETFKQAWRLKEEGDKAEKNAQPQIAVEKYSAALQILQTIQKSAPEWDPKLVNYHARDCTLHIARNTRKLNIQTANAPAAPASTQTAKTETPAHTPVPTPTVEQIVEDSIPTAGIAKAPKAEAVPEVSETQPPLAYNPSAPFATEAVTSSAPAVQPPLLPPTSSTEATSSPTSTSTPSYPTPSYTPLSASTDDTRAPAGNDVEARLRRTEDELRQMQELAEEHSRALLRDNNALKQRLAETEDALFRAQGSTQRSSTPDSTQAQPVVITDDKELQAKLNELNRQLREKESELYALRTSPTSPSDGSLRADIPKDIEQRLRETEEELRRTVELSEEHSRALIKDNNYLRDQLLTFEDNLQLSQREVEAVKSELKTKADEYIVMQERLAKAESDLQTGFKTDDERVVSLLEANTKLRQEIEILQAQGGPDVVALRTENDTLKKRVEDLLKEGPKTGSYAQIKSEIDKALVQLRNASPEERRSIEAQLLEKKVVAAEDELKSTNDQLIALNEEKTNLIKAKKELEERAKKAEELAKAADRPVPEQVASLMKDNSDLAKKLDEMKNTAKDAASENEKRIAKLETENKDLRDKLSRGNYVELEQPVEPAAPRSVDDRLANIEKIINRMAGNSTVPGDPKLEATIHRNDRFQPTTEETTIIRRSITGTVIRLDPKENFVVINFGSGYVPPLHSELDVYREGQVVGSIRITNPIKPPFASANILAGSLRHGDVIR